MTIRDNFFVFIGCVIAMSWLAYGYIYQVGLLDALLPYLAKIRHPIQVWLNHLDQTGMASAMLIGQVDAIDARFRHALQFLGVYHVLVISGMHVQYMYRFLDRYSRSSRKVVLGVIVFCVALSGLQLPSVRAVLSLMTKPVSRGSWWKGQTIVLGLLLILYPHRLLSASLWLSMIASTYMMCAYRVLKKDWSAAVGIQLVMWPLLYAYGMNVSSWSWLISPWLSPLVMIHAGLEICLALLVYGTDSRYIHQIRLSIHDSVMALVCDGGDWLPDRGVLQWPLIVVLFLGVCGWGLFIVGQKLRYGCMVLLLCWSIDTIDAREQFRCFEVGHGLSCLWNRGNRAVLYDTARKKYAKQVSYYLKKNHIVLDAVILSHSDSDHTAGSWLMLKHLKRTGQIYGSPRTVVCEQRGIHRRCLTIQRLNAGDKLSFGQLHLSVLSPWQPYRAENQMSLVLKCEGSQSYLLTGDIDQKVVHDATLLSDKDQWKADFWLEPHHGRTQADFSALGLDDDKKIRIGVLYESA